MDQQGEKRRARHNAWRVASNGYQDAIDDRVEHPRIRHDPEVHDGENEHPRHRGNALNSEHDEASSLQAEPPINADSTGTAISAANGVIFLVRMTASKARTVANPRKASI